LAKLPRALAPLIERPQWAVWRWTQLENGRWQKPPFMAMQPERHASTKDPGAWSDYATALNAVQAGKADGISYVLTENDPFAAIDLDHCRDIDTRSIDVWAQNFLDTGRHTYSEVTPSGDGCRIWGLANGHTVHKKFTLEIDGKDLAVELFRRTRKALTITGCKLDTIRELTSIDRVIDWGIVWGKRRKAAAAEAAVPINGNGFNGNGSVYSVDQIEQIVREELQSLRTAATCST
jgi:primase-polymerase (primpol)-like protein